MWSVPLIAVAVRTVGVCSWLVVSVAAACMRVLVCWLGVCWVGGVVWCQCSYGPWRRMSGWVWGVGSQVAGGCVPEGVCCCQLVRYPMVSVGVVNGVANVQGAAVVRRACSWCGVTLV